ncbi:MAG: DUF11 domain-containing protein [Acidimicrobiales bacterium]|nr:DUF11 domain-containing protein [Acidimicrobiales bacterium]
MPVQPQLSIEKATATTQILPGGEVQYAITVTNPSAAPATEVTVTDTLPAGLTFESADDEDCGSDDGVTITCELGGLAAGASVAINVVARAADPFPADDVDETGGVANTAAVTSPDTNCPADAEEPAPECTSTVVVPLQPLLSIEKSAATTQIVPGAQVAFSITVTNTSAAPATEVSVSDVLPAGLTFVSASEGCTSPDSVAVTCALALLPADTSATFTIITAAADPFPAVDVNEDGEVANTASVTSPDTNCPGADACSSTVVVPVQPQLAVAKASSSPLIVPGEDVTFTITVTNTGPSIATDVTVTDTLPTGLRFVSSDNEGCSSPDAVTVNCELGDVAVGASLVVQVVTVAASPFPPDDVGEEGTVANTASVASPDSNCPPDAEEPAGPCASTVLVSVTPQVLIQKSTTATEIVPGATVPFAITVTNSEPVVAPDVTVTDTLPAGLTFVSADNPGCSSADGVTITCDLGALPAGSSVTVTVVTVAADPFPPDDVTADGEVANTATVTSPGTNCPPEGAEPTPACSSTVTVPVPSQLSVTKSSTATQVVPGGQATFEITISNAGPLAADVTLTDPLPAGLTFVSADNEGCSSDDGVTVTCDLGSLAAGGSLTVIVVTEAADPFPADDLTANGGVPNTASVTAPGTNCPPEAEEPAEECGSTVEVPLQAQVSVEKTSSATAIVPGETVPFEITVTNTTPVTATDVTITDELPAGLTFVSSTNPGCSSADGVAITCSLGDVAAGGSVTIEVVTAAADPFPADDVTAGGVANAAAVTSPESNCPPDAEEPAEECGSTVVIPLQPQLSIAKTSSATLVVPGGTVPFTLTITNTTPVDATDVTVTDELPAGLTFVSSSDPDCDSSDGTTITCALGSLAAGESVTVEVVAEAADPFPPDDVSEEGTLTNRASVTSPESNCPPDATDPDAECASTVTLPLEPWLRIEKTTSATQAVPGEQLTYDVTVTNETSTTAIDVTVTDILAPGLTFVSSDNPACTSADGTTISCSFAVVGAGSPLTFSIVTQVADPFPSEGVDADGSVPNTATVTSPGSNCPPEAPGPPVCTSTVVVPLQPRVTIEKSTTATRIDPGGQVPYTIVVTNTGPVTAPDVIVTDRLPVGLTFSSAADDRCTSADGATVTCQLGDLEAGGSATIELVTDAADPFPADSVEGGVVANVASVTSPGTNCDVVPLGGVGSGPALRTVSVSAGLLQVDEVCESTVELPIRPTVAVTKVAGVDRIVPGAQVPYRIEVTNTGPVTAADVVVTDRLPDGFVLVSSSDPRCAATDVRTVICSLGDLEGGATVTIDVLTRAPDPLPAGALDPSGGVANTATVTSPGSNCDPLNPDGLCSSSVVVPPADEPVPPPGPTEPPGSSAPTPPSDGRAPDGGLFGDTGPFGRLPRTGLAIIVPLVLALAAIGVGLGLRRSGRSLRQRVGRADR